MVSVTVTLKVGKVTKRLFLRNKSDFWFEVFCKSFSPQLGNELRKTVKAMLENGEVFSRKEIDGFEFEITVREKEHPDNHLSGYNNLPRELQDYFKNLALKSFIKQALGVF